jgi:hypothetical protein
MLTHETRHCADAILSFSNEITLVANIVAPLLDFASTWVQSNSNYDFIIAGAFPPTWCSIHRPVLSLPDPVSHWVYSAVDHLEPDGCLVICHRGCGREHLDPASASKKVKVTCLLCHSTCEVKVTEVNGRMPLGRKGILKVAFPTTRAETNWSPPKEPKPPKDPGATQELGVREVRGRLSKGNSSRARGGRGDGPTQRPQTHSVPRLPSEALAPRPPPVHTRGPFLQPPQGVPPFQQLPYGWLPAAHSLPQLATIPPPPAGALTLPFPPTQMTPNPQRQAKRQKTDHNSPTPPS